MRHVPILSTPQRAVGVVKREPATRHARIHTQESRTDTPETYELFFLSLCVVCFALVSSERAGSPLV
jgi:hypothetical protein